MRTARSWLLVAALVTLAASLAVGGRSGPNDVTVAAPPLDHVPVDTCPVARGELAGLVALSYLVTIDGSVRRITAAVVLTRIRHAASALNEG